MAANCGPLPDFNQDADDPNILMYTSVSQYEKYQTIESLTFSRVQPENPKELLSVNL